MERVGTPVAVEPCARLGFISPDGKFFPCCHCAHHDLGARLWNLFSYPGEYKGDYYLQLKGWVSIKAGGAITHKDQFDFLLCPFTPEQKSTVREIIETFEEIESRSPETNWDKELSLNPENYTTLHWEHSVMDGTYQGSFAKSLRNSFNMIVRDGLSFPVSYRIKRPDDHPGD